MTGCSDAHRWARSCKAQQSHQNMPRTCKQQSPCDHPSCKCAKGGHSSEKQARERKRKGLLTLSLAGAMPHSFWLGFPRLWYEALHETRFAETCLFGAAYRVHVGPRIDVRSPERALPSSVKPLRDKGTFTLHRTPLDAGPIKRSGGRGAINWPFPPFPPTPCLLSLWPRY